MFRFTLALFLLVMATTTAEIYEPEYKECGACCMHEGVDFPDQCGNQDSYYCITAAQICQFEGDNMGAPLHECGSYCCDEYDNPQFEFWMKCAWYQDMPGFIAPYSDPMLYVLDSDWCGTPCCEDPGRCCYADYEGDQCYDSDNVPLWAGTCLTAAEVCQQYGLSECGWSSGHCCDGSGNYYSVSEKCEALPNVVDADWCAKKCDDPPTTFGDPHFKTWHGHKSFEYHGECDLVLLKAPVLDMDIHVRTTIRYDYSYVSQAALRIGDETFEVDSYGQIMLNGVNNADLPNFIKDYPVTATYKGYGTARKFEYNVFLEDDVIINMASFKDYVSVKIYNGTESMFYKTAGMMGDFQNGNMFARDGKTVLLDPEVFAPEWQVRAEEDGTIFASLREPQYPTTCIKPDASAFHAKATSRRRLGAALITEKDAKAECAKFTESDMDNCVEDVLKTQDTDIAAIYE